MMAERRALEIIWTIQPSIVSDRRRQSIIRFLQRLIKNQFGVEVFPFGSVPLKTYLPDGDIDLTVVSHPDIEKDLVSGIYNALIQQGENNRHFPIRHVTYVKAKVKVVKCEVINLSVDISFNQMEGLSALCFFEQVDQLIGRDHLFKRSIILIKAWCYYESRVLGAQSGLLSTYAIEVLVLNIINYFHQTLIGPLSVLYKFLDYYGNFNWDCYCVSLDGLVPISSLPNILVEPLHNNLLLGRDFIDYCKKLYSIPIQAVEPSRDTFPTMNLNIVDPLKVNNNLGRSVATGHAKRIRFAFLAGAKKLKMVFMERGMDMGVGIEEFFFNSIERNGKGQRMDSPVPVNVFGTGKSEASDLRGNFMLYYQSLLCGQLLHGYAMPHMVQHMPQPPLAARFQDTNPWNIARQFVSHNVHNPQGLPIIFVPIPLFAYHVTTPQAAATLVHSQNLQTIPSARGTGTYIPLMSQSVRWDGGRMNTMSIRQSPVHTRVSRDTPGTSMVRNGNKAKALKKGRHTPVTTNKSPPATVTTRKPPPATVTASKPPPATVTTRKPQPTVAPTPLVSQLALETAQTNMKNLKLGRSSMASTPFSSQPLSSDAGKSGAAPSVSKMKSKEKSSAEGYKLEDTQDFPPL